MSATALVWHQYPPCARQLREGCIIQVFAALLLQVVALLLRSAGRTGESPLLEEDEMDYSLKLNKELPADIRVLAWSTVPADFSARHASASRLYLQAVCHVNLLYRSQSCVTVAEILGAI